MAVPMVFHCHLGTFPYHCGVLRTVHRLITLMEDYSSGMASKPHTIRPIVNRSTGRFAHLYLQITDRHGEPIRPSLFGERIQVGIWQCCCPKSVSRTCWSRAPHRRITIVPNINLQPVRYPSRIDSIGFSRRVQSKPHPAQPSRYSLWWEFTVSC